MSPDSTAFPRQFSRAQWKASADVDDKRRLGVITSRNGPEWQCTNWSGQPQTEMHGDRKLLLLPSDPPDDPTSRGTERCGSTLSIVPNAVSDITLKLKRDVQIQTTNQPTTRPKEEGGGDTKLWRASKNTKEKGA
ncbi:hypothetical protein ElyMa_004733400 [Elysia marginata]|uniref:Uncharacterized protein n=1 Tax=Elysia marginata TaxID=1093978 RepID=A0AAV4IB67_9GAST|nr:hypothetical protein ElyMa_004733400 [Elysia marginata]